MIPVMVKQSPPVHRRVMVTPTDLLQRRKQIKHFHSPGYQIRQHPPLQLVLRRVFRFRHCGGQPANDYKNMSSMAISGALRKSMSRSASMKP